MSQTFQDAIAITIGLELEFIWIGSICIIQDSRDDRVAESAKVADIYRKSFLKISAYSSKEGLGAFTLTYKHTLADISCKVLANLYDHKNDELMDSYGSQGTMNTRGWVSMAGPVPSPCERSDNWKE